MRYWEYYGFFNLSKVYLKKHNYLNLFLALFIPVGMHGLYNFSFSSTLVSYKVAYFILLIFSIRAYLIFKNLKLDKNKALYLTRDITIFLLLVLLIFQLTR